MSDPFTPQDLAAARAVLGPGLGDCPFCGGFSRPDPRHSPTRCNPTIVLDDDRTSWWIRCFSCSARVAGPTAWEASERWNRRTGVAARKPEMLPFVDVRVTAERLGLELTPAAQEFANEMQRKVLQLNRRPL